MLRLDASALDYAILAIYFLVVLGIGVVARMSVKTDIDFFLSGRSLPAWITGLAFVAANLGALEILGMAANGAQYGVATVHFYQIGAVPAMVFLGIVMMPFYYGANRRAGHGADRLRGQGPLDRGGDRHPRSADDPLRRPQRHHHRRPPRRLGVLRPGPSASCSAGVEEVALVRCGVGPRSGPGRWGVADRARFHARWVRPAG